jgi:hypothetical protein
MTALGPDELTAIGSQSTGLEQGREHTSPLTAKAPSYAVGTAFLIATEKDATTSPSGDGFEHHVYGHTRHAGHVDNHGFPFFER